MIRDNRHRRFCELPSFQLLHDQTPPDSAIESFRQDGVVCLRYVFGPEWLELIEQGIERALGGASTDLDIAKKDGDAGTFSFSSHAWRQVEPFRQFIFESPIADIAWSMLDTRLLVLFYDFLLIKQPRSDNAATPWHQDHSYYPLDGIKAINCWTALDEIPMESALRFVRGSHKAAILYRAVDFDDADKEYRHARKDLALPPEIDNDPELEILTTAMQPGDLLVWSSYTLHSAAGNRFDKRRAAFSVNWLGDDITYNAAPSLETYRDASLAAGDPIICEKFPLLREA